MITAGAKVSKTVGLNKSSCRPKFIKIPCFSKQDQQTLEIEPSVKFTYLDWLEKGGTYFQG